MLTLEDVHALQIQFGTRCQKLRHEMGLSQLEFSTLIGMDRSYYASIETGSRNVTLQSMAKIAEGFEIPIAHLLEGMDTPETKRRILLQPSSSPTPIETRQL